MIGEPGQFAPDAYYGSFALTLVGSPLANNPVLTVEPDVPGTDPDLPLGTLRAGSTTSGSLTATNTGDAGSTLEGVTFGALTGNHADRLDFVDTLKR